MSDAPEQWAGDRVARWLAQAPELERQLAPVSAALAEVAAPARGERVLDVGCGTGPTSRDAAVAVGLSGEVTGLDVAAGMLDAAASVPVPGGSAAPRWVCADLTTWDGAAASYDLVLSRFGVMFFADPAAAMANLARVTAPGGRLAFAVWGPRSASPLFEAPYQAARATLAANGHPVPDEAPADAGPYSWSDEAYVVDLLTAAGWREASVAVRELVLPVAGGTPDRAARAALDFGPTRALMLDRSPAELALAERAIAEVLAGAAGPDGLVHLPASVRLVTARR